MRKTQGRKKGKAQKTKSRRLGGVKRYLHLHRERSPPPKRQATMEWVPGHRYIDGHKIAVLQHPVIPALWTELVDGVPMGQGVETSDDVPMGLPIAAGIRKSRKRKSRKRKLRKSRKRKSRKSRKRKSRKSRKQRKKIRY